MSNDSSTPEAIFGHQFKVLDYISSPLTEYPAKVVNVTYGKGLIATRDLAPGEIVDRFEGPFIEDVGLKYEDLNNHQKQYVLCTQNRDKWTYLIPLTTALYANHACDPNSDVDSKTREIYTVKHVKSGEQITFLYNEGDEADYWDPIWSFDCFCGAPNCQKKVDRYRSPKII